MRPLLSAIILLLLILPVFGQTPPPGGGSAVGAPIDGMGSVLITTAVVYGINRLRSRQRK